MPSTPYAVAATFHVRPDAIDATKQMIADVTAPSLKEDGVEVYRWSQGADDPTWFLLYMEYRDKASFDAHVATPHVKRAEAVIGEKKLLVEPSDERHYQRL